MTLGTTRSCRSLRVASTELALELLVTDCEERAARLPVVLATVYTSKNSLRVSSPRAETLEDIEEKLRRDPEIAGRPIERQASPLPFAFLDADLWIFRIPPGFDADIGGSLTRESIEIYFENLWIHRPRHGLDGRSPLGAARQARQGDLVARAAKLHGGRPAPRADRQPPLLPGDCTTAIPSTDCGGGLASSWLIRPQSSFWIWPAQIRSSSMRSTRRPWMTCVWPTLSLPRLVETGRRPHRSLRAGELLGRDPGSAIPGCRRHQR